MTLVGRIGGEEEPMIEGLAAFTIVDPSLKACSDIPGDNCETPWDYCCESAKRLRPTPSRSNSPTKKGSVVAADARKLFGVEPLSDRRCARGICRRTKRATRAVVGKKMYVRK